MELIATRTGVKTLVMGILNATPDSFFDGGALPTAAAVFDRGRQMVEEGADILDVGGESSRPGAAPISLDQELGRVLPSVERLTGLGVAVSIDTYRAETARRCLSLGAAMVNDITALRGDPAMAGRIAEAGCDCVLMHMQGTPETMQRDPVYQDVVGDICDFFEERMQFAAREGIKEEAIWLDPGFGFGKTAAHNLEVLRRLGEFRRFGRPVLIGTSNKSTIGKVLGLPLDDRMEGTAATVAIAIAHGADCVRVHNVRAMARVAAMSDAVMGRGEYG